MLGWLSLIGVGTVILWNWRKSEYRFIVYFVLGFVRCFGKLWHGCRMEKPHIPFPESGPAILMMNHTASSDPLFVIAMCPRMVAFLYAQEFGTSVSFIKWCLDNTFCIPVERDKPEIRAARKALSRLQEGRIVGIFPEANLRGAGGTKLRPARCGVAWLALRSRAPVHPIYITGGPQSPDLLDAWAKPSKKQPRLRIGPAVDLTQFYDRPIRRPLLEEVTQYLMDHLAALALKGKANP